MRTVTAAEFNHRPSHVKRVAAMEPVAITEHNHPAFVLLRYDEYERLTRAPSDLATCLEMDTDDDFEIEPVGLSIAPVQL